MVRWDCSVLLVGDNMLLRHKYSYVEIKCQLDATEVFIADLIACLTTARNTTGSNHRIILLSS